MIFDQFRKRLDSILQDLEEKQNRKRDVVSTFLTSIDLKTNLWLIFAGPQNKKIKLLFLCPILVYWRIQK